MQRLKDCMSRDVKTVRPEANLNEVAEMMRQSNVGIIPVVDGKDVHGLISDRDIVVRALAGHRDPRLTRASDIMTQDVYYGYDDQDLNDAAHMMRKNHVRRLVVLDRNKNLTGIFSLGDLASSASENLAGQTLRHVSTAGRFSGGILGRTRGQWGLALGPIMIAAGFLLFRNRPEFSRIRDRWSNNMQDMKNKRKVA